MCLKIGISGKREILPADYTRVYDEIKSSVKRLILESGTNDFVGYTSLAKGADTIFAHVVTKEFKKPLCVILPFDLDEFRKDFENAKDLEIFNQYIAQFEVAHTSDPGFLAASDDRGLAYFNVGKQIVDQCDEMLFVSDLMKPNGQGGTSEIVGYFQEKWPGKQLHIISVKPAKEELLYKKIDNEYESSNMLAIAFRDKYRSVWKQSIVLGFFVVVCFAYKILHDNGGFPYQKGVEFWLTLLEFILVVYVFFKVSVAIKQDFHGNYLKHRLRAEILRLLRRYYQCNMSVIVSDETTQMDEAIADIAVRINSNAKSGDYTSKWYVQYTLRELINEQILYHKNKIDRIGGKDHKYEMLTKIIGRLFLLNLALHLVIVASEYWNCKLHFPHLLHNLTVYMTIILPALYASVEGFLYFNEWAQIEEDSEAAYRSLEDCLKSLPAIMNTENINDWNSCQLMILNRVSNIMLSDNKNWNMILKYKNNYHLVV